MKAAHIIGFVIFLAILQISKVWASDVGQTVTLRGSDLKSLGQIGWHAPEFSPSFQVTPEAIVDPQDDSPGAILLRRLFLQGKADGFDGVLYENRDRGHSTIATTLFPGLRFLVFDDGLKAKNLDYGLAGKVVIPSIVFGNSSTAMTSGAAARSQPRLAMTSPLGPQRAFLTYTNNQIYVYPEHRDHDDSDQFPANWPYMIISQGSSGSDGPFLKAIALTLAALTRETKRFLHDNDLVAPTIQMVLRRSLTTIYNRAAYLSPAAHPVVFDETYLAPERMVALAAALKPSDVPPMVRLEVEAETFSDSAGLAGMSEKLFTTPSAIARTWRGLSYSRELVVSAGNTKDPNGRTLAFNWVLLQGDKAKVKITPLDPAGRRARIRIDWHDDWQSGPPANRRLHRVDIGVFAWNGVHDSAPAMISIGFPSHQARRYGPASNGEMLIKSIDYSGGSERKYFDPWLYWRADWRDEFMYGPLGNLTDWTRHLADRDIKMMERGGPVASKLPTYQLTNRDRLPVLTMVGPETVSE